MGPGTSQAQDAFFTSAVINTAFESSGHETTFDEVTRPIIIAIFAVSGLGALALSLRSLMSSERSIVVWAALAVGLFATALMIGEFTFLE